MTALEAISHAGLKGLRITIHYSDGVKDNGYPVWTNGRPVLAKRLRVFSGTKIRLDDVVRITRTNRRNASDLYTTGQV